MSTRRSLWEQFEGFKNWLFPPGQQKETPVPPLARKLAVDALSRGYDPQLTLEQNSKKHAVLDLTDDDVLTSSPERWNGALRFEGGKPTSWLQKISLALGIQLTSDGADSHLGQWAPVGHNAANTKTYLYAAVKLDAALRHLDVKEKLRQIVSKEFVEDFESKAPDEIVKKYGTHFVKLVQLGGESLLEEAVSSADPAFGGLSPSQQREGTVGSESPEGPGAKVAVDSIQAFFSPAADDLDSWVNLVETGRYGVLDYTLHQPIWKLLPDNKDGRWKALKDLIDNLSADAAKEPVYSNQTDLRLHPFSPKGLKAERKLQLIHTNEGNAGLEGSIAIGVLVKLSNDPRPMIEEVTFSYDDQIEPPTQWDGAKGFIIEEGSRISRVEVWFLKEKPNALIAVKFSGENLKAAELIPDFQAGVPSEDDEHYSFTVPAGSAIVGVRSYAKAPKFTLKKWAQFQLSVQPTAIVRLDLILRTYEEPVGTPSRYDIFILTTSKDASISSAIAKELRNPEARVLVGMPDPSSEHFSQSVGKGAGRPSSGIRRKSGNENYLSDDDVLGAIHTAQVFAPLVTNASALSELEPYGEVVKSIFSEFRKKKALSIPIMGSGLTKDDNRPSWLAHCFLHKDSLPPICQEPNEDINVFARRVAKFLLGVLNLDYWPEFGAPETQEEKTSAGTQSTERHVESTPPRQGETMESNIQGHMPHARQQIAAVVGADPTLALESVVLDRAEAAPSQVGFEASSAFKASPALKQTSSAEESFSDSEDGAASSDPAPAPGQGNGVLGGPSGGQESPALLQRNGTAAGATSGATVVAVNVPGRSGAKAVKDAAAFDQTHRDGADEAGREDDESLGVHQAKSSIPKAHSEEGKSTAIPEQWTEADRNAACENEKVVYKRYVDEYGPAETTIRNFKESCAARNIDYADAFLTGNMTVEDYKKVHAAMKVLNTFWKDVRKLYIKNKLALDDVDFFSPNKHWFRTANAYRELVEPLDIANWYKCENHKKGSGHYFDTVPFGEEGMRPSQYAFLDRLMKESGGDYIYSLKKAKEYRDTALFGNLTSQTVGQARGDPPKGFLLPQPLDIPGADGKSEAGSNPSSFTTPRGVLDQPASAPKTSATRLLPSELLSEQGTLPLVATGGMPDLELVVRHPLALWECNFASLEKLPYSSTHRSAELRYRSGRNDLLLKTPNSFLRIPVELSNPLTSHTLVVHMKRQAVQMDFVPVGIESTLGDVYERLQVDSTLRPGWSFLSSKWGSVVFETEDGGDELLESKSAVRTNSVEDSIRSLFLVVVVNHEAGKVELYKAEGVGTNLYYIDMFEPLTSFQGTIEVVFRNSSKGSTRFQFAALYDSALGRDDILGLKTTWLMALA